MKTPHNLYLPRLRELIDIPQYGDLEQDWDLLMANSELVGVLLGYYESENLNAAEKNILMQLIIASYDDKLCEDKYSLEEEQRLTGLLEKDFENLKDIFEYWALPNNLDESGWTVTPLLRKIWYKQEKKEIEK